MGSTLPRMELEASERTFQNHPAGKRETLMEPYGHEALAAFDQASALVKLNRYSEALAVKMRESDRQEIERRIRAASANSAKE